MPFYSDPARQLRLLDSMPAVIWSASASSFRFFFVSKAAETILGYPVRRWIDEPDFRARHIHPDDQHVVETCRSATRRGEDHELVYRMIAADGRIVWFRDTVKVIFEDGVATELSGVMTDITRERTAELALVESSENYRRLVDLSPDCIGVHVDGIYVYANDAFGRLLGARTGMEIVGRHFLSIVEQGSKDLVVERQVALAAGKPVPYVRERLMRLDGSVVDVEAAALPVTYSQRAAVQVLVRDITDRVMAEERLRARETRLQTLAAGTNEAIYEWAVEDGELWTNAAHRQLFGIDVAPESIVDEWLLRVHPEDRDRALANASEALGNRTKSWWLEYRFLSSDGTWRDILDRGSNIVSPDGTRRAIGAMLDITLLRQAERHRAAAEAKFRSIVEQAVAGVYIRRGDQLAYVNETAATMLGMTVDELMALEQPSQLVDPDDLAEVLADRAPAVVRAWRKDGEKVYLACYETSAVVDGEDVRIGTLFDITEKQRVQEQLFASEQRYRELVDHVRDILYSIDAEGRIVSLSQAFERITGWSPAEWVGRSFTELFLPHSVAPAIDHFQRALGGQHGIIRTYDMRSRSGAVVTIEVSSQPRIVDGEIAGTVGMARDVTQARSVERKLDEAKRLSSLGQLAASLAHEFNNVLMGIQPFVEVIARRSPDSPDVEDAAAHIRRAVGRGKRASQEILRFANPKDSRLADVEVRTWLPGLIRHLEASVPSQILLRGTIDPAVTSVHGDREHLEQVITNLVFNARDAIAGEGTISVEVTPATVCASADCVKEECVRIRVSDDGPGIPPEIAERIFDPLFTTKRNGTGLGLSIAMRLMQGQGGTLTLARDVRRGTAFDVFIPAGKGMSADVSAARPQAASIRRVLLVEDDESVGEGLRQLLEIEGMETVWVRDAAGALLAAGGERPDAAIVDVNLPDGNGVELAAALRREWNGLPIVLSTGHVELERAHDERMIALMKPYEVTDLIGALSTVVSGM